MIKYMTSTTAIVGVVLFLALMFSTALAQSVPDPALYFNPIETDQDGGDKAWRNAGTAGGELGRVGNPRLEEGVIKINAIGFKQETKWYTAEQSGSIFTGGPGGDAPVVNLEDFTMGLLMKINGGLLGEEHHLVGLQAAPAEQVQNMRIWLDQNGGGFDNVSIAQGAIGARADLRVGQTQMTFAQKKWHWAHLVFESGDSLTGYINGEQVSKSNTTVKWSDKHDMNLHTIFAHSPGEAARTGNSLSLSTLSMTGR